MGTSSGSRSNTFSISILLWSAVDHVVVTTVPFTIRHTVLYVTIMLGPPLENNPEIPPSSRDEGLRLLHGLETNLAASLQTPQEA